MKLADQMAFNFVMSKYASVIKYMNRDVHDLICPSYLDLYSAGVCIYTYIYMR